MTEPTYIAVDTEYNNECVPFIGTSTDERLKSKLYDLKREAYDVETLHKICKDKAVSKVFHAACNDIYALAKVGIDVKPPYEDTMIAAAILNENFESKRLKSLAKIYLDEACEEEKALSKIKSKIKRELTKQGKIFSYEDIPADILYPYAKKDTEYTIKLWYLFKGPIRKYQKIYDMEKRLIPIIVDMVKRGIKVDRKFIKKTIVYNEKEVVKVMDRFSELLKAKHIRFLRYESRFIRSSYGKTMGSVEKKAAKNGWTILSNNVVMAYDKRDKLAYRMDVIYREPFNPGSVNSVRKVIKALAIPVTILTEEWETSTESKALEPLQKDHEFIRLLLRYRFLTKQLGTYYRPLYYTRTSEAHPYAHFMLYQSGAKTGRFTADLIQTIPRNEESKVAKEANLVRKSFIPRKGYRLVFIDFSQIEMRLFAHYAKCELLIQDICDGYDPHLGTAIVLFGKDVVLDNGDDIKKLCRNVAKTINFGLIYGMGVTKLRASLEPIIRLLKEKLKGKDVHIRSPHEIMQEYHANYPVKAFCKQLASKLYKTGTVHIEFKSKLMDFMRDYRVPERLAYKGPNVVIQGSAAYVLKAAILRAAKYIKSSKKDIHMLTCIHDEIAFEVSDKLNIVEEARMLQQAMEDHVTFAVPILAEPKVGMPNWGDAMEVKFVENAKVKCHDCKCKTKEAAEYKIKRKDGKSDTVHLCYDCYDELIKDVT